MESETTKPVNVVSTEDAKSKVSDVEVVGNPDAWELICKASSKKQKWMKSTKAMKTKGGVALQVSTQVGDAIAEAVEFIPGADIKEVNGHKTIAEDTTKKPTPYEPAKRFWVLISDENDRHQMNRIITKARGTDSGVLVRTELYASKTASVALEYLPGCCIVSDEEHECFRIA